MPGLPSALRGWRLPLRLAWREVRRAPGRSALVLVLISLPVLAVTIADTVYLTSTVSGPESAARRMGSAQARLELMSANYRVLQLPDPDDGYGSLPHRGVPAPTIDDVRRVLGEPDAEATALVDGEVDYRSDQGLQRARTVETDFTSDLTTGLAEVEQGRLPRSDDEVAVTKEVADGGPGLGDDLETPDGVFYVVGIVRDADSVGLRVVYAQPQALAASADDGTPDAGDADVVWLIGGAPITWEDVLALNRIGVAVASRAVLADPPPPSEIPGDYTVEPGSDNALTVILLVVAMVLLEVVLLAGPAFAVMARRQSRDIALVAVSGGEPAQARRMVLGGGVVLGLLGGLIGVTLGVPAAALAMPAFQSLSVSRFGPFQVSAPHLLVVAGFGMVSAVLAAFVPALIASRQDVVAVLAGRRPDTPPSRRSPVLGLALVGLAAFLAASGARADGGEALIALAAIVSVVGTLFLIPAVVTAVSIAASRLPLIARFSARDAARHRTRTVPAVAAITATVAGVITIGIAVSSTEQHQRAQYEPLLPMGDAQLTASLTSDWDGLRSVVETTVPGHRLTSIDGIDGSLDGGYREATVTPFLVDSYATVGGSTVLVADRLPRELRGVDGTDDGTDDGVRNRADRVLAAGGVVAFASADGAGPADGSPLTLHLRLIDRTDEGRRASATTRARLPATVVETSGDVAPAVAVLSTAAARRAGLEARPAALDVDGPVSPTQADILQQRVRELSASASLYREGGYHADGATRVIELILILLGAALMLGGTITATFLALSDARPDLATLQAVGAAPGMRRTVAATYALVLGLVGAVLGAAVGFVPGIAISYPLTRSYGPGGLTGHTLDVPWLLVAVVVLGLPVLSAAVVGLAARGRLPLSARQA